MITTTIFPGRYIQGAGALEDLGQALKLLGDHALVICDPFVWNELLDKHLQPPIEQALQATFEKFGGESSDEEISRLIELGEDMQCDVIVGVGGGKTLDTAKAVCHEMELPVAIVPTLASTDAPCSALAVIYTPEGEMKRYLTLRHNPNLVLLDTQIVVNAPVRFLVSGMGDALATWFEAESCRQNYAPNMTGRVGSRTGYRLARLCYETLLEYGLFAKHACEAGAITPALEHIVEANTLLSGLGFESGGLAASHAIHNGLTVLPATHDYWHGEKVAIGTLTSLFLTDKTSTLVDEVYSFCEAVGLPTTLAEIGLNESSTEDLMRVAERACSEGETIHNEPVPVTPADVVAALKVMSAEGQWRKRHN
jgi:glycerol dehydrogenase